MGRTGLGTLLRDFFRGTEAALVDALRRDRIEVCIPCRGMAENRLRRELTSGAEPGSETTWTHRRLFLHLPNFSFANRTESPDGDAVSSQRHMIA